MPVFHGIAVYEITFKNGKDILDGKYTNTVLLKRDDIMDMEIAKKEMDTKGIVGEYDCTFKELVQQYVVTNCTLKISNYGAAYKFEWRDTNTQKMIFNGIGLKAGDKHIAVSYTRAEEPI